jgi:hypothetical protein
MEKILAIQSVNKKIERQMSVLVGNYEFYYAAGAFKALFGADLDKTMNPEDLKRTIDEYISSNQLTSYEPSPDQVSGDSKDIDDRKAYLVYLMNRYETIEKYEEIMMELFDDGYEYWSQK